jgi:hypothetical protein
MTNTFVLVLIALGTGSPSNATPLLVGEYSSMDECQKAASEVQLSRFPSTPQAFEAQGYFLCVRTGEDQLRE